MREGWEGGMEGGERGRESGRKGGGRKGGREEREKAEGREGEQRLEETNTHLSHGFYVNEVLSAPS